MSGRKNHGNNSKRFDVNSFYAYIKKAHVEELLDKDGNTPYDSDSIDKSVWEYAAYLYKDIQDYGGLLSYFDSETFRADSDGSGNSTWTAISRTDAISQVYKPLRRWLYSLDSEEGINNTMDLITSGFNRKYYTLPLSDSEGTLRHVNVYTFLKSHFDRWLRFDPYERRKIASRIADNLDEDSDVRYRYADNVIIAMEEDSDLSRRLVELISNVLQTDSEVRNEIIKTTITGFRNDSDAARDLARIIGNVLETDSDVRNEYADSILTSIRQDSDQQVELGLILSSHEFTELSADTIYTRKVLPMDSDNTGSIGDSDNRFALGNFTTVLADDVKVRSLAKDRVVFIGDSEGRLATSSNLQWQGDSELVIEGHLNVTVDSRLAAARVTNLEKDGIVFVSDSDGRLATNDKLRFNDSDGLIYDGVKILAIDSDKFVSLLIENIDSEFSQFVGLDSEAVEKIIGASTIISEVAVPVGPVGNIYYIDSDNTNKLVNDAIVKIHTGFYSTDAEITAAKSREDTSQYPHLSDNDSDGDRYRIYDMRVTPSLTTSNSKYHWFYDSDNDYAKWQGDSETTINGKFGVGRLFHNPNTKKTWYNDGSTIHEIGTARTFSDVIVMENLTSPPDSDELGFEGLRPGTIAVADGVSWDPAGYGGLTPYPVFWDGGQWLIFTLF